MSGINATTENLIAAAKYRCSCYQLTNKSPVPDSRVADIIKAAIEHLPSSFNVQSTRAVVLLKAEHEKLWDLAESFLKKNMPEGAYKAIAPKVVEYRAAYGSVLWFEDQAALKSLLEKQPMLSSVIPEWSNHTNGMHQFFVWQALTLEGFGCNLQHYNFMPDFEAEVKAQWKIPITYALKSQLVFGTPTDGLVRRHPRTYAPVDDRVFMHGSS